jgi:hypothetical protein
MAAVLRLRKKCSGERRPDKPEGDRANQGAFQVVGNMAELIGATDTMGGSTATVEWVADVSERRRSCLDTRAGREIGRGCSVEGANEKGEMGERGVGSKADEGVRRWSGNARTWARPRRGHG